MIHPTPDTSRDEKILAHLRRSMSGWSEAISIASNLNTSEAVVLVALRRLLASDRVQRRILTGSRAAVEWAVKS
jgi:predicted transcriptional regulator